MTVDLSRSQHSELEPRIGEIGRELFSQIDTSGPWIVQLAWWDDLVLDWSMRDPLLKTQLFRFIDVLPTLATTPAFLEHFRAYMAPGAGAFPWPIRLARWLGRPGGILATPLAKFLRANTVRMAGRFIAGETPFQVLKTVERLRAARMTFTMDLLGEATATEREADEYLAQYLSLLEYLAPEVHKWERVRLLDEDPAGALPRINLSVKLSALASQFDPIDPSGSLAVAGARLREIFRSARRSGALINLDMEQYEYKDLTLAIFQAILSEPEFRDWPDVGIAIQAYLRDTEKDLRELRDWADRRGTPIWVRLVKGAYWDSEALLSQQREWPTPVWTQKWQSDACYERCAEYLLEHRALLRPALASHNVRSIAHALAFAERLGVERGAFEFQMLHGMGDPLKRALVDRQQRLRIYTPFGKLLPGMAYLVRRLLENTSNSSFLRATFRDRASIDRLLQAPQVSGHTYRETTMPTPRMPETLPEFSNEPWHDFSKAGNREKLLEALTNVKGQLGQNHELWIGPKLVATRNWLESRNPAEPSQLLGRIAKAGAEQVDQAVAAARSAFEAWRKTSAWSRAGVLFELARRLRQRRTELAAWMILECGKQWREADADVAEAIDFCEYYGRSMLSLAAPRYRHVPAEDNTYTYSPRGVCVVISPWNFPLAILCGMATAPLVAGNTVILKPAEQASLVAAKFAEIVRSLDLPPGVVQFLPGVGEEIGPQLVAHPDVDIVTFTGSVAVGLGINKLAAETWPNQTHVKRVLAEMGGKNAIIVDSDADQDEAVRGVMTSAFGYQGQKCSACSRVIILADIYDAFVRRLADAVTSLTLGPPESPAFAMGPVIDGEARDRLLAAIDRGKREAKLLAVGVVPENSAGYYCPPVLFGDADPKSFLGQEELFGPVLTAFRAANQDEALRLANGVRYALTGGVYSRNPQFLARAKDEFQVGNLYINRKITGAEVDRQPFGGFKLSGIGAKAGGPVYLLQFLTPRTITENTLRRGFAPE